MSEQLTKILEDVLAPLQGDCTFTIAPRADGALDVSVQSNDTSGVLIGKDGQNLRALEHVVRIMLARKSGKPTPLTIDINDYRRSRAEQITSLARAVAGRVRDTRKSETLDPMNPYERRVVHTELATWTEVASESIGQEPYRRIIIKPL